MTERRRFPFAFALAYRFPARVFGITPATALVELNGDEFDARFGPWRVRTPLANISEVTVTGPYHFLKTAGPARLAITDRGLTFATNGQRGVRVSFRTAVPGLDPLGLIQHPELTVTVADVNELATALVERMRAARSVRS